MIPYLSESLREFIKPTTVHNISSLSAKYVSIDFIRNDEVARRNHAVNGYSMVILNATNEEICSADRFGYVRRYAPCGPNSGYETYVSSGIYFVGFIITISTYGDGVSEETFMNQLAKRFGTRSPVTAAIVAARENVASSTHISKEGRYFTVFVKIDYEYFKGLSSPVFFKELDIVISKNCDFKHIYHPEQPGTYVFENNLVKEEMQEKGYSKSYILVENRTNICREVWILSGLEIIHLKSLNLPDIESGVYITKNNSDYDGTHDTETSYVTYEKFIDGRIVFSNYNDAIKRLAFLKECMAADEKSIEVRRAANRKLELDYMRGEELAKEKKESKYIDTVLTILKYGSIIAAAILIKYKAA